MRVYEKFEENFKKFELSNRNGNKALKEEDACIMTIDLYRKATKKSDIKLGAKLIKEEETRLKKLGLWKYINEDELNQIIK